MPRKSRVLNGRNALKAGQLGERAVRDVLALSEPDVEVKTMQLERHTFSVELTQLERMPEKVYVVCAYSRGNRHGKRKKNQLGQIDYGVGAGHAYQCQGDDDLR